MKHKKVEARCVISSQYLIDHWLSPGGKVHVRPCQSVGGPLAKRRMQNAALDSRAKTDVSDLG